MKNQFKKKAEAVAYCEKHCPKPYDEQAAAVWVADQMNLRSQTRDYSFIQSWALANKIDYDVAYCWELHRLNLSDRLSDEL